MSPRAAAFADRDYRLSLSINRWSDVQAVRRLFVAVSRLGDGPIWYALIFGIPLVVGVEALPISIGLSVGSILGVLIYKAIKLSFKRPRPYATHSAIQLHAIALDEFSFPSGHTLHAVCFVTLLAQWMPMLAIIFLPFTILTALSRVILGLHYLSDVLFGAAIGLAIASILLLVDFTAIVPTLI